MDGKKEFQFCTLIFRELNVTPSHSIIFKGLTPAILFNKELLKFNTKFNLSMTISIQMQMRIEDC